MATKLQYETVFNSQYTFLKPKKYQCFSCSVYEQIVPRNPPLTKNTAFIYRKEIILNSKLTGEKLHVKQLEQSEVYDLKPLIEDKFWRCHKDGSVVRWPDVIEVGVVDSQPNKLIFKYNFEDTYSELDINYTPYYSARRRESKRPSTQDADVCLVNVQLQGAYHEPIPISKTLHTDLVSLYDSGAIPRSYHPFYQSSPCSEAGNENTSEELF